MLGLFLDPAAGHYLLAAGLLGHALWDLGHHRDLVQHRATGVVPRWHAEACFVVDIMVGTAPIVAPLL